MPTRTITPVIDIHAHLLAAIDDGPATDEESVELARSMTADGVTKVAATPHLRADHPGVVPEQLAGRRADLERRLAEEGVDLSVVTGGEVDVFWGRNASDEALRLVSYGQRGTDLLVETPYGELPHHFERTLDAIRWRGYRVVLAHPERNPSSNGTRWLGGAVYLSHVIGPTGRGKPNERPGASSIARSPGRSAEPNEKREETSSTSPRIRRCTAGRAR